MNCWWLMTADWPSHNVMGHQQQRQTFLEVLQDKPTISQSSKKNHGARLLGLLRHLLCLFLNIFICQVHCSQTHGQWLCCFRAQELRPSWRVRWSAASGSSSRTVTWLQASCLRWNDLWSTLTRRRSETTQDFVL